MKNFKNPEDPPFRNQGDTVVCGIIFIANEIGPIAVQTCIRKIRRGDGPPFEGSTSRQTGPKTYPGTLKFSGIKPTCVTKFQQIGVRVEQKHAGGVDVQLRHHLIQQNVETQPQLEATANRQVNGTEGAQKTDLLIGFFKESRIFDHDGCLRESPAGRRQS